MSDPVFFTPARSFTAADMALVTGASLHDEALAAVEIDAIAPLASAHPRSVVYLDGKRNASHLKTLTAGAIFCAPEFAAQVPTGIAVLTTSSPLRAFAQVGRLLFPTAARPAAITGETGVSPRAFVDPSARLEPGVIVEVGAVIAARVAIGSGTVVGPNAVVGPDCRIGRDCFIGTQSSVQFALIGNGVIIHPGAKIGQDGFGFVPGARGPERIPQVGRVIIQDNVEIGANSAIDRGAMDDTVIGENTKIDNLVQIAHNVKMGRNCVIAGRVGISGSVKIGDGVMMGGGAGLADHLDIGDGVQLAAGSGLMHDIPAGEIWGGFPAKPLGQAMREFAMIARMARAPRRKEGQDG